MDTNDPRAQRLLRCLLDVDICAEAAKDVSSCFDALFRTCATVSSGARLCTDRAQHFDGARATIGPHDLLDDLPEHERIRFGKQFFAGTREAIQPRGLATRVACHKLGIDHAIGQVQTRVS